MLETKLYYTFSDDNKTAEVIYDESYTTLQDVVIPSFVRYNDKDARVTTIGNGAFENCEQLLTIHLSDEITCIGEDAFSNCTNLTSITLPVRLRVIGDRAFDNCQTIKSICIPSSVRDIGVAITRGCQNLQSIVVEENNPIYDSRDNCNAIIEKEGVILLTGCSTTIIPQGIETLQAGAFYGSKLLTIVIPDSVKSIEGIVFAQCTFLETITLGKAVIYVGDKAFENCTSLRNITLLSSFPPEIEEENCFDGIDTDKINVSFPNGDPKDTDWKEFMLNFSTSKRTQSCLGGCSISILKWIGWIILALLVYSGITRYLFR